MTIPDPFTPLQTIDILLSESQNELTRIVLQERLAQRSRLRGVKNDQILAAFQAKAKNLAQAIADMKEMRFLVIREEKEKLEAGDKKA